LHKEILENVAAFLLLLLPLHILQIKNGIDGKQFIKQSCYLDGQEEVERANGLQDCPRGEAGVEAAISEDVRAEEGAEDDANHFSAVVGGEPATSANCKVSFPLLCSTFEPFPPEG